MTLFSSIELGEFRLGIRYKDSSGWKEAWLLGDDKKLYPEPLEGHILHPLPKEALLVIESKSRYPEKKLYAYFGKPAEPYDSDMGVELAADSVSSPGFSRWISDNSRSEESLAHFASNYWGVADLTLHILNSAKFPIHEDAEMIFTRTISVGYDEWRTQIHDWINNKLSRLGEKASVVSPLHTLGALVESLLSFPKPASDYSSLEQFYLIEAFFDHYITLLRAIAARPCSKIEKRLSFVSLGDGDFNILDLDHSGVEIVGVESFRSNQRTMHPVAYWGSVPFENFDIPENRFVSYSCLEIGKIITHISGSISSYVRTKISVRDEFQRMRRNTDTGIHISNIEKDIADHEAALRQLEMKKSLLENVAVSMRHRYEIGHSRHLVLDSEILHYDGRYSQLRALHFLFLHSISTAVISKEEMPFQVVAFNQLYQHYVLLCTVQALLDNRIGFEIQDRGLHDPLYGRPLENAIYCKLVHPKFPGLRLEVWNERRYPYYRDRSINRATYGYMDDDRKRGGAGGLDKHRPDISLELWHNGIHEGKFPKIVTLDATISKGNQDVLSRKYTYFDNIRCFDSAYEISRGLALPLVMAAWAVYPGRNKNEGAIDTRGSTRHGPESEYSMGNICLHPKNEHEFVNSIRDILQYTILDSLNLDFLGGSEKPSS